MGRCNMHHKRDFELRGSGPGTGPAIRRPTTTMTTQSTSTISLVQHHARALGGRAQNRTDVQRSTQWCVHAHASALVYPFRLVLVAVVMVFTLRHALRETRGQRVVHRTDVRRRERDEEGIKRLEGVCGEGGGCGGGFDLRVSTRLPSH